MFIFNSNSYISISIYIYISISISDTLTNPLDGGWRELRDKIVDELNSLASQSDDPISSFRYRTFQLAQFHAEMNEVKQTETVDKIIKIIRSGSGGGAGPNTPTPFTSFSSSMPHDILTLPILQCLFPLPGDPALDVIDKRAKKNSAQSIFLYSPIRGEGTDSASSDIPSIEQIRQKIKNKVCIHLVYFMIFYCIFF